MGSPVGEIPVLITGDFSELAQALQQATQALEQFASGVASAMRPASAAADEATSSFKSMAEALIGLGEALAVTEGLKEFGQEALTAYGTVQSVTIGLTQLTGSVNVAAEAVEQIKDLAATEPFAFPEIAPTIQKMVALGVSAEQLPGIMQAVADASAATGNSFQQVANSIDRMSLSGTVNARSLTQLGISTKDLGAAMGVTGEQVKVAFQALDQSERLDVLEQALEKFSGAAIAQAQGIAGAWQIFQNQFEEVMVGIGEALAPDVAELLKFGSAALSIAQSAVQSFELLPAPVREVAVAIGLVTAAIAPLTVAVGSAGLGVLALRTALTELGITEATVATETVAVGTAAGVAAVELDAATVATTGLAGTFAAVSAGAEALIAGLGADILATGAAISLFATETIPAAGAALLEFAVVDVAAVSEAMGALATGAIATLSGALPILAVGLAAVAVGFAAWDFGSWIGNSDLLDQKITSLIQKVPLLQKVVDLLAGTTEQASLNSAKLAQLTGTLQAALADVGVVYDKGAMGAQQYANALLADAGALGLLGTSAIAAAEHQNALGASVDAIAKKVSDQNAAVTLAKQTLDALKDASDGSQLSLQKIAAATAAWQTAVQAASEKGKDWKDTIAGLTQAMGLAEEKAQSSIAVYDSINGKFDTGSASLGTLAAAYKKAQEAAAAAGEAFASAAGEQAKINQSVAQTQATYTALQGAYQNLLEQQAQGVDVSTQLSEAYTKLEALAKQLGTSFYDTAGAMAQLGVAASEQQSALQQVATTYTTLAGLGQRTVTQQQELSAAFRQVSTDAAAMGLSVQKVGDGLVFTAANASSATPALNALAQQMTGLYSGSVDLINVNGKLVPSMQSVADAANASVAAQANLNGMVTKTVQTMDGGTVTVLSFADAHEKLATSANSASQVLGPMAQAAANALLQVNGLGTAAKNAADTGLDPFSAAAVAAHVSMDNYTGSVTGASGKLTDVFSPAAVAASVHINEYTGQITNASGELGGPFSAAVVGASISIDEYTGKVQSSTGAMTDSTAAAKEYAAALDNVSYAAQDAAAASGKGGGGGGDASGALAGFAGFLSPFSAGLLKNFVNTGPDPLINSGGTADAVAAVNLELEKLSGSYGQIYSGAIAATDPLINFGKVVTAASTATTSSTAATTSATTAVVAYTGATTAAAGAMSDLPLQIDPVTGAIISLGNASSGTANMIAYGTSSLGSATSSASTAVANLGTSVSNGSLTWDQFIQGVQGYTQQIDQGTISLTDGTAAMGALAQQALNAAAALQTIPGSGGGVAGPAQANLLNPNGLTADAIQKAWNTYNQATDTISQGLSTVTDGTVQAASTQQTTFAAYQKAADTLNQTLGVMAASASGMTSNIGGLLTNGEGQGPASYNAQTGTYTVSQTVQGETFTAQGQSIQAAQAALSQLLLHSQNPFGTAAPGSGGQIGQSAQGTNYAAYALPNTGGAGYSPQTPSYTHANPLPVSVTNSVPPAITINISGVGQTSQQVAQSVQQSIITTLRQAGLKI